MGLIVVGSFNWAKFAHHSLGEFGASRLRWMFRNAKISWDLLLQSSIARLISHYGITMGVLALDDSDKMRSCNTSQIISQLRKNQLVRSRGRNISLTRYFSRQSGVSSTIIIRGGKEKRVSLLAARLVVKSHKKKRFVIADWKGHGGWNTLSKQPGMSVGCLIEHINAAALIDGVSHIVHAERPKEEFDKFKILMERSLPDRNSSKHLAGRDLGRMEPTPSLKYQNAA